MKGTVHGTRIGPPCRLGNKKLVDLFHTNNSSGIGPLLIEHRRLASLEPRLAKSEPANQKVASNKES